MYWSFVYRNKSYVSWGKPRSVPLEQVTNIESRFDVHVYQGEQILPEDKIIFMRCLNCGRIGNKTTLFSNGVCMKCLSNDTEIFRPAEANDNVDYNAAITALRK